MSVKSDFFKIRRTAKSSRPLIYINSAATHNVRNKTGIKQDRSAFDIDLSATIYPKLKAWQ